MERLINKQEEKERAEILKIVLRNFQQENFDKLLEEAKVAMVVEAELLLRSTEVSMSDKRRLKDAMQMLATGDGEAIHHEAMLALRSSLCSNR